MIAVVTVVDGDGTRGLGSTRGLGLRPVRSSVQDVDGKLADFCVQGPAHAGRMHQRERREIREVDGLLAAERRAAAAAVVVFVVVAAVAVKSDDDRRAERDRRRAST